MYYRVRLTYRNRKGTFISSTMNLNKLPQLDAILRHLDCTPGSLTVYWTEIEQEGI